jgi:hypothetical protein
VSLKTGKILKKLKAISSSMRFWIILPAFALVQAAQSSKRMISTKSKL